MFLGSIDSIFSLEPLALPTPAARYCLIENIDDQAACRLEILTLRARLHYPTRVADKEGLSSGVVCDPGGGTFILLEVLGDQLKLQPLIKWLDKHGFERRAVTIDQVKGLPRLSHATSAGSEQGQVS